MTFARRLSAATMALVLALFPVAMERCWTACITPAVETEQAAPTAPSAHDCHEVSPGEDGGARMEPLARACGHSDEARTNESAGLTAAKTRTAVLLPGLSPLPREVQAIPALVRIDRSLDWSGLLRPIVALNSPLRL